MSLIVEDGTGLPNAESYASVVTLQAYAGNRGLDISAGSTTALLEQALRRATTYIDTYRARFSGYRTTRRVQALEWPRVGSFYLVPDNGRSSAFFWGNQQNGDIFLDPGYDVIASNVVPPEIINGTCEAAVREIQQPGYLLPDDPGLGLIQSQKAGGSEQRFFAPQTPYGPKIPAIALILAPLLMPGGGCGLFGTAAR